MVKSYSDRKYAGKPLRNKCLNCSNITKRYNIYCDKKCESEYINKENTKRVLNGETNNIHILRRILKQIYGNVCMSPECAWDFSKIEAGLEIHHIDGNYENNSIGNLILLCRNCHSLTETYGRKNLGNGRYKRRQRYKEDKS